MPTEASVGPCSAEGATRPMEKMPHPRRWLYLASYRAERQGDSRASGIQRALSTSGSDLERRSAFPDNRAGREGLVRLSHRTAGRDLDVKSLQVGEGAHRLSVALETAWTTMLQSCLNMLGAYWSCDRRATWLTALCRFRFRPLLANSSRRETRGDCQCGSFSP